jgi:hypothetical protein
MRKGAFTLLLRQETTLGLKEARAVMLRVLDEQPVTLELPDEAAVARLRGLAQALGVRCGPSLCSV